MLPHKHGGYFSQRHWTEHLILKGPRAAPHWPSLSHVTISDAVTWMSRFPGLGQVPEARVGLTSCEVLGGRLEDWLPEEIHRKEKEC